jgi:hypothetical protein
MIVNSLEPPGVVQLRRFAGVVSSIEPAPWTFTVT